MADPQLNADEQAGQAADSSEEGGSSSHSEIFQLRARLAVRENALRDLGRRLGELEAITAPSSLDQDVIDTYEARLRDLSTEVLQLSAQLEDRDRDVRGLTEQLEDRDRDRARLMSERQELERVRAEGTREEENLRDRAETLQQQVLELQVRVQALESLRILRYTARPRNWLYRLLRRLEHG